MRGVVVAVIPSGASHPTCSGVWTYAGNGRHVIVTEGTVYGHSYRHPSYNASTHRDDVAVIELTSTPRVSSATLAGAGTATSTAKVTTVGYGTPHLGQRRNASEVVRSWSSWRLYLRPGNGNSCDGDSGGPDLLLCRVPPVAKRSYSTRRHRWQRLNCETFGRKVRQAEQIQ